MNDIILNLGELKNILRIFGKDIIEGIEHILYKLKGCIL